MLTRKRIRMSQNQSKYLPLLLLPLIIFLCFVLWSADQSTRAWTRVESDTAVFDARQIDFSKYNVSFNRCVEYIPNEFLTPEEFEQRNDRIVGEVPDGTKSSTMRIRILVPNDKQYGIAGYSVNYASSVYVNGKWLFDEGHPGMTAEEEKSSESFRVFSAEPQDGVIEILIQTSAFSNIDTSSSMGWNLGEYEQLRILATRKITMDIVIMTCYIVVAIVALLLLLVLPNYKANGWLAVLAVVWAIRTGLKNTKILLTLFPDHEWSFVYKTEIITSFVTILLLALIMDSVFPRKVWKWLTGIAIGGSMLAILYIIAMPWQTFLGHSIITNPIVYWVMGILSAAVLITMRKEKYTLAQIVHLSGVALVLFAFLWDQGYFKYELFPWSLTQPMMLVFTAFMMVAAMLATMQKTVEREILLTQTVKKQEQEIEDARISMMLSQIQPHFLYNSLGAIENLTTKDPAQARIAIHEFSKYLRGNLDSLNKNELIPFEQELSHIEHYVSLEQMRFREKLRVQFDIQAKGFFIPPLTVQPIIENAIRYGVGKKREGGTVWLKTAETAGVWQIIISDDGIGFDPEEVSVDGRRHIGIENARTRLAALSNGTLDISSVQNEGTTVTISIPKGDEQG